MVWGEASTTRKFVREWIDIKLITLDITGIRILNTREKEWSFPIHEIRSCNILLGGFRSIPPPPYHSKKKIIIAHRYTLENTEGAIKNGQCSETGNIVYTRRNKTTGQYVLDTTIHIDKQIT